MLSGHCPQINSGEAMNRKEEMEALADRVEREWPCCAQSRRDEIAAALRASAAPEEGMEIEDASEIVFLDAAGGQHRIVYDICEDRPGLGSGWFLHEDDTLAALPSDSGKAAPDALIEKIATEAERYASDYPQSSDGRNTFIMFADFVRALAPATEDGEIRQHIAWLFQYVQGMNPQNWRDMKLRAERQLEQLSLKFPGPAVPSADRKAEA